MGAWWSSGAAAQPSWAAYVWHRAAEVTLILSRDGCSLPGAPSPPPDVLHRRASKAALASWTYSLRFELAPFGVKAVLLAPGKCAGTAVRAAAGQLLAWHGMHHEANPMRLLAHCSLLSCSAMCSTHCLPPAALPLRTTCCLRPRPLRPAQATWCPTCQTARTTPCTPHRPAACSASCPACCACCQTGLGGRRRTPRRWRCLHVSVRGGPGGPSAGAWGGCLAASVSVQTPGAWTADGRHPPPVAWINGGVWLVPAMQARWSPRC
jgi:hypothetical protein